MNPSLLVIDTGSSQGAVGVFCERRPLATRALPDGRSQSELLLPAIATVLCESELSIRQVAAIVVATGPGAFTALRVGMATAKALAEVAAVPLVGVTNAAAAAVEATPYGLRSGFGLVILPASRGEVYLAPYSGAGNGHQPEPAEAIQIARLEEWSFRSSGGERSFQVLISPEQSILERGLAMPWGRGADTHQSPASLLDSIAGIGHDRFIRQDIDDSGTLDAAYVRRADADRGWLDPHL